jgi:hypothetical protein
MVVCLRFFLPKMTPARFYVTLAGSNNSALVKMMLNDEFGQANTVGDLVAAYFPNLAPSDRAAFSLRLPEGMTREESALNTMYFTNEVDLKNSCPLNILNSLGLGKDDDTALVLFQSKSIAPNNVNSPLIPLANLFVCNDGVLTVKSELKPFIKGTQSILIRKCYIELLKIVLQNASTKAVISGTPGIGKTLFLIYCSYILAMDMKKTIYLAIKGAENHFLITPFGYRRCKIDSSERPKVYEICYLLDSLEPFIVDCELTVLTVSPRMHQANEFKKLALKYYMPLWDWNEIMELVHRCKVTIDEKELKQRFDILNGVPRRLFETQYSPEEMVNQAISQSDIESLMNAPVSHGNVENVAHCLVLRTTPDFVHFQVIYASRFVSRCVYENIKLRAKNAMYAFVRSSKGHSHLASVRDSLYEYIAHDLLIAGGEFKRRRLDPQGNNTNMVLVAIPQSDSVVEGFANIEEAYSDPQSLDKFTYFQPKYGFETVGSWKQEYALFQHTVARNHGIKKLIHEVSRACKSSMLYFIVPDYDICRTFKYQAPDPPENGHPVDLKEYVLWVPVPENI